MQRDLGIVEMPLRRDDDMSLLLARRSVQHFGQSPELDGELSLLGCWQTLLHSAIVDFHSLRGTPNSFSNASLVGRGDAHIFAIFCDGTARHVDSLSLQSLRNLF